MKIGYSYAKEKLTGGDFTELSLCSDDIAKSIAQTFEKKDLKKTKELVGLVKDAMVIDSCLPYGTLLAGIEDFNAKDADGIFELLMEYGERQHDTLTSEYLLTHAENALFKYHEIDIAEKYINKVIANDPQNRDALELAIYAHVECTKKDELYKYIGRLSNYTIVKKLLDFGYSYEEKIASIDFILDACYNAVVHHDEVIDYLNTPEILGVIVCFFKPDMKERFSILFNLAVLLKEIGEFDESKKIFDSLLDFGYNKSGCHWNIIQCKLKVRNDEELVKIGKDFSNMDEYDLCLREADDEGLDPMLYSKTLKRAKKRKRNIILSLIVLMLLVVIIVGTFILAYYLYSHGIDKPILFGHDQTIAF